MSIETILAGWVEATFPAGLRVHVTEFAQRLYFNTGWTRMRRWQGLWARRFDWSGSDEFQEVPYAGIEGPSQEELSWVPNIVESAASAGEAGWTAGLHAFQYRYRDSTTGWVSNASYAYQYVVTAASKKLTFDVGDSGAASTHIKLPDDPKVDEIVLEATAARASEFFLAGIFPIRPAGGSASSRITSITVEISDAELLNSALEWEETGHGIPPVKRFGLAHRDRLWLYGEIAYTTGYVSVVAGSTTVVGSGTAWTEDALGTVAEPAIGGQRLFHTLGGLEYYPIAAYLSPTQLQLATYAGFTASGFGYEIVSGNQLIYFSLEGTPESFSPLNFLPPPVGGYGGAVTALAGLDQGLLIYTPRGCWRYTYGTDPLAGTYSPTPGERGAVSPRVVVPHGGRVYALDFQGVWVYSGGLPVDLSAGIRDFFAGLDWSYSDKWHAIYLHESRCIRWYVTADGETEPQTILQLFLRDGEPPSFSFGDLPVAATDSHLGRLTEAQGLVPVSGDENGYVWWLDRGVSEGADGYSHLVVTGGTTTTLLQISGGGLPTDGSLRGVAVTWVRAAGTLETRVVTAHDADTLEVSSAFSAVPANGDTLWLGRIPARLLTKAWYGAQDGKVRFRNLRIYFTPLASARYLQVRCYSTHGGAARTWAEIGRNAFTSTGLQRLPGLVYPGTDARFPATDWLVDLSYAQGMVEIPVGPEAAWMQEIELVLQDPETELELWRIELDGVEERSPEN